jgi:DNA-binding transcriptional ArsR family regulator
MFGRRAVIGASMAHRKLTPALLALIADRFRILAEPARLEILHALRDGEKSVSDLIDDTRLLQANASKHLQLLHAAGFVKRRKDGLFTYYSLADRTVFRLCDIMCGQLDAAAARHRKIVTVR